MMAIQPYKLLLGAVLVVGLVGCQSPSKTAPQPDSGSSVPSQSKTEEDGEEILHSPTSLLGANSTGIFDSRVETAMKSILSTIAATCVRENSGGLSAALLTDCMQEKSILALEPSGLLQRHCKNIDFETAFKCTFQGYMLMKLREKSKAPISDTAWTDLEAVLAGEATAAAMEETFECMRDGQVGPEAERVCMAENFAKRLGANPIDARQCLPLTDDTVFGQCLGEAAAMTALELAATRVRS